MKQRLFNLVSAIFPVFLAIALSFVVFAIAGFDLLEVGFGIIEGTLTGFGSFTQTLRWAMPMLLIGLGFMFSARAGEFNIGGQGQMILGGLGAVSVALLIPGPPIVIMTLAVIVAVICSVAWSALAGVLKLWFGADEVIVTLMQNFIALLFVAWMTTGHLKDPASRGDASATLRIDGDLRLSGGEGMSVALLVILALVVVVTWLLAERTRFGLQLRYVGQAELASRWQGLDVRGIKMKAYLLAGLFAGLAGALEVLGPNGKLVSGASPTVGFTAIVVATVGMLRVPGIVLAALFFGGIQAAVLFLPIVSDLPPSGLRIMEGAIALLITAHFIGNRRRT